MRAVLFVALTACSYEMRIPGPQLQADLALHFPMELDKHVVVLRVSDPQLELLPNNRVGVRVHVRADTPIGTLSTGTVRAEGRLEYDPADHAFYARAPVVTQLDVQHVERVESVARFAVAEAMRHYPIYRLDAKRGDDEAAAIKHLRKIRVDGNDLLLEVGI
ncbi:MAG: DUF1439 domain-containing protein [Kofleriaceae bacterium]